MRSLHKTTFDLNRDEYYDKMYACWIGKNIGGTIGGPYEGRRELLDVRGFSTPEGAPLPNDDLDLQLVWLHAMEEIGPYDLTAEKLGEMWLSYITPCWNEYGICKANMRRGLIPPLSGQYKNNWKDSNGAWIRTEIWASLFPAKPDAAAKYSYYDAAVDHGLGEGTYAAVFIAALESAAYVISDIRRLIEIGLRRIPADCRVARSIDLLLRCYDGGMPWRDARNAIFEANKDIGDGWFEAPSNVAYAILGVLYGGGDFKKTVLTAVNCGDDTDCTGATAGSIMGILGGTKAIPDDWKRRIGDEIITICVPTGVLGGLPKTCSDLARHTAKTAEAALLASAADPVYVRLSGGETGDVSALDEAMESDLFRMFLENRKPYSYSVNLNRVTAEVSFDKEPDIAPGESVDFEVALVRPTSTVVRSGICKGTPENRTYGNTAVYYSFRWFLPEGFSVAGPSSVKSDEWSSHGSGVPVVKFTLTAGEKVNPVNRAVLEIETDGGLTPGYVPVTLIG